MLNHPTPSFVEVKTVTWSKDSHGLFDYESKNVNFTKNKVETSSRIYRDNNTITIKSCAESDIIQDLNPEGNPMEYLFSIENQDKAEKYLLKSRQIQVRDESQNKDLFLIVRSLKNEDGTQKGYTLELGDIIRLGRIEYRVIEYQNQELEISSLLTSSIQMKSCPFKIDIKDCGSGDGGQKLCRICLMDETDCPEVLVSPCNCKGTSQYVHIKCLQDWISSKVKKKVNPSATCLYWKKLNCEVCKVSLPDLVEIKGQKLEILPIYRPQKPYILLERVFYDKSKANGENSKMMVLLSLSGDENQIKLGRGHECDLRENDISVSRLHAFIKYQNGRFCIFDNNSKFGTLVLLRKDYRIEKKKIALQIGRIVITFSLKHSSINNVPIFRNLTLTGKLMKSPKENSPTLGPKPSEILSSDKQNINGSFIDDDE